MKQVIGWGVMLVVLTGMTAVRAESLPRETLTLSNGKHEYTLQVEVAETSQQRSRGLMEREELAENAGMLFLYDREQSGSNAYWMYRTWIPLDIAFIDSDGIIRSLKTMSPCRSASSRDCPVYPAGASFRAALETNAGYFKERGLAVGDRLDLSAWLDDR